MVYAYTRTLSVSPPRSAKAIRGGELWLSSDLPLGNLSLVFACLRIKKCRPQKFKLIQLPPAPNRLLLAYGSVGISLVNAAPTISLSVTSVPSQCALWLPFFSPFLGFCHVKKSER